MINDVAKSVILNHVLSTLDFDTINRLTRLVADPLVIIQDNPVVVTQNNDGFKMRVTLTKKLTFGLAS